MAWNVSITALINDANSYQSCPKSKRQKLLSYTRDKYPHIYHEGIRGKVLNLLQKLSTIRMDTVNNLDITCTTNIKYSFGNLIATNNLHIKSNGTK